MNSLFLDERRQNGPGYVTDVRTPRIHLVDLLLADVDAGDIEAGLGEFDNKRQANVS
jgi:hypothetical protein